LSILLPAADISFAEDI